MSALEHRVTTKIQCTGQSCTVGAQGASIFMGCFACQATKQTNRINDQLIAMSRIPVGNLTVPKLVQQFPVLYGIQKIISYIVNNSSVGPSLSQLYPLHALLFYISKFYFNIILSCAYIYIYTMPPVFLHSGFVSNLPHFSVPP